MLWRYQSRLLPPLSITLDLPLATLGPSKMIKAPAQRKARRTARRALSWRNSTSRCPPLCYLVLPPTTTPKPQR